MGRSVSKNKRHTLLTIIVVLLYIVEYHFVYEHFVADWFGYTDIHYYPLSTGRFFPLLIQAALPVIFFRGINGISSFFSFFIYVLVYIPFVDSLYTCGLPSAISSVYGIVFLLCMSAFFITDRLYIAKTVVFKTKKFISLHSLELFILVAFFLCVFVNRGNITFVNFLSDSSEMYERRASYATSLNYRFVYYLVLWLSRFFIPFLSVIYIQRKKYIKLAIVVAASVVVYMINMQKATLVIPLLIVVAYLLYHSMEKFFVNYIPILFLLVIGISSLILYSYSETSLGFTLGTIFIMRAQCIEGMELDRYMHFFAVGDHPVTHYTHISLINKLTGLYPYNESIGRVVAGDGGNSNATFWLMDGVAAEGVLGVIIISILFIIVKGIINSIGLKYDYMIVVFSLLSIFSTCANVSLFTTILSGGLLIAYLTYIFIDIPSLHKGPNP